MPRSSRKPAAGDPPAASPPRVSPRLTAILAAAIIAVYVLLAGGDIVSSSPTSDETAHLAAGYLYLTQHDYRMNPEHPPLLKKVAALPLFALHVWPRDLRDAADGTRSFAMLREAWAMAMANPGMAQWRVAQMMLYGIRDAALTRTGSSADTPSTTAAYSHADFLNDPGAMFLRARLMMLLVGVALALVIFFWSREVWGSAGALVSLLLFCFDPNFIAHSGLITNDVGISLFIALTMFLLWRLRNRFSAAGVVLFAAAFSLALCTKFSGVFLVPLVVLFALTEIAIARFDRRRSRQMLIAVIAAGVAAPLVIWAMYGFRFTAVADPSKVMAEDAAARTTLVQKVLAAPDVWPTGRLPLRQAVDRWDGTRALIESRPNEADYTWEQLRVVQRTAPRTFVGRALLTASDRRLFPEAYVYGFAWAGATSLLRSAFLDGELSDKGFPGFFFRAFLYKTPILEMVLIGAGLLTALRAGRQRRVLAYLLGPALMYAAIAIGSNINIGYRHFFPVLPFVFVACGSLGLLVEKLRPKTAVVATAVCGLALALTSSVVLVPKLPTLFGNHLSYLNEIAGGPIRGFDRLSDSNFDWGQDVARLAEWTREHHLTEPINLYCFANADPRYYGIRYYDLRKPEMPEPHRPGYLAISQMDYFGVILTPDLRTHWRDYLARVNAKRVGTAGYSIFIYRVD